MFIFTLSNIGILLCIIHGSTAIYSACVHCTIVVTVHYIWLLPLYLITTIEQFTVQPARRLMKNWKETNDNTWLLTAYIIINYNAWPYANFIKWYRYHRHDRTTIGMNGMIRLQESFAHYALYCVKWSQLQYCTILKIAIGNINIFVAHLTSASCALDLRDHT